VQLAPQEKEKTGGQVQIPTVGQRVCVMGERGEYMIIRVDRKRHLADLMHMGAVRRVEEGVPLQALRPLREEKSNRLSLLAELKTGD